MPGSGGVQGKDSVVFVPFSSFSAFFGLSIFMILFGSSCIFHVSNMSNLASGFSKMWSAVVSTV